MTDFDGFTGLEHHDVREPDQLYKVQRTQIDVVLADGVGVLNADDERVLELAGLCDGEVLLYTRQDPEGLNPAVQKHLAEGGRAAVLRHGCVRLVSASGEQLGVNVDKVLARHGRAGDAGLAEALLAAAATAWAFGISPELIGAGLETFELHPPA